MHLWLPTRWYGTEVQQTTKCLFLESKIMLSTRQEHCSGLPFLSPMHESEKWKWSRLVVSDSSDPMDCSLPGSSAQCPCLPFPPKLLLSQAHTRCSVFCSGTAWIVRFLRNSSIQKEVPGTQTANWHSSLGELHDQPGWSHYLHGALSFERDLGTLKSS